MSFSAALLLAFIINCTAFGCAAFYVFLVKKMPLYHPVSVFLAYFLIGYVYRPLADYIVGGSLIWTDTGFQPTGTDIFYAAFIACVGLFSFVFIPVFLSRGLHDHLVMPRPTFVVTRKLPFALALTAVTAIGVLSYIKLMNGTRAEVIGIATRVLQDGAYAHVGSSGYEILGVQFIPAILMVLYFLYGFNYFTMAATLAYVFLRMYIGAERSGFLTIALGAGVIYLMRKGRANFGVREAVIAVLLVSSFELIGFDRMAVRKMITGEQTSSSLVTSYQRKRADAAPLADFQEFESMSIVTALVPEKTGGYNWFSQYRSLLIRPIPRSLWYDKPVNTGFIRMIDYGRRFGWITYSAIGDAYTNFGLPSVCLILGFDGWLLSFLYKKAQTSKSATLVVTFATTTSLLPLLYRDGGWMSSLYFLLSAMAAAILLIFAGGIKMVRASSVRETSEVESRLTDGAARLAEA